MYNVVQQFYHTVKDSGKIKKGLTKKFQNIASIDRQNEQPIQMEVTGIRIPKQKSRFKRGGPNIPEPEKEKKICLTQCRYDVVKRTALQSGFQSVPETDAWNIIWSDCALTVDKALEMRRFQDAHTIFWGTESPLQKANHFPGMNEICRKDRLARNLNRMKNMFPSEYNFFPKSWCIPAELPELEIYATTHTNETYICKPDSGSQGKGIFLIRDINLLNESAKLICQIYIPRPLLLNGYKFDLRIYTLITSCEPLRVYVYNEGIARFATIKYSPPTDQNVDIVFMHLTNYSLNKYSESYVPDIDGSKRKMSELFGILLQHGYNVGKITDDIDDLVVKTLISGQPALAQYYKGAFPNYDRGTACFEILGFDILIDENLKPWLLEVNHSPSFNLDLPVDVEVKESLLRDTFKKIYLGGYEYIENMCNVRKPLQNFQDLEKVDRRDGIPKYLEMQFHHEKIHQGNYRLLYPAKNNDKYLELLREMSLHVMEFVDLTSEFARNISDPKLFRSETSFRNGESYAQIPEFISIPTVVLDEDSTQLQLIGKRVPKVKTKKHKQDTIGGTVLKKPGTRDSTGSNPKPKKKGKVKKDDVRAALAITKAQDQTNFGRPMDAYEMLHGTNKITYERISFFNSGPRSLNPESNDNSTIVPQRKNVIVKKPPKPKRVRDYVQEAIQNAQKVMEQSKLPEFNDLHSKEKQSESSIRLDQKFISIKKKLAEVKARELEHSYNYNSYEIFHGKLIPSIIVPNESAPRFKKGELLKPFQYPSYKSPHPSNYFSYLYPPIFDEGPRNQCGEPNYRINQAEFLKMLPLPPKIKHSSETSTVYTTEIKDTVPNPITEKGEDAEYKKKTIEDWITTGEGERTRLMVNSQYAELQNPQCAKSKKRNGDPPKIGSGVHICEDNYEVRRPAEYFQPPKIHQKINQIHKHITSSAALLQEENERKAALMDRDKLIRNLGIDTQAHEIFKKSGGSVKSKYK